MNSKGNYKDSKKKKKNNVEDKNKIMFDVLANKTEIKVEEIRNQYTSFMEICPEGTMTKIKFVELVEMSCKSKNFDEENEEEDQKTELHDEIEFLADSLFRVFDDDKSGTMDFSEYIMALNATKLNSPEDKLRWIFNVFDRDGGGTIDKEEIKAMISSLFSMSQIEVSQEEIEDCTNDVMSAIDINNDGEISREEFVSNAINSKFIYEMLCEQ